MILALTGAPLIILSIIAFIVIIGVIVAIHEGGHFFFAKRAGILCHEFSIGMGPIIYHKQFGETKFCIRAIPIGGFVSMAGEDTMEDAIKTGTEIGLNLENDMVSEIILDDKRECQIRGKVVNIDLYGKDNEELYVTLDNGFQSQYYPVKRNAFYVFEHNKTLQITPYDRSFESKSLLNRFLTIFAGPVMNFILAIIIYLIVAFATGVPNYGDNIVGTVSSSLPAASVLKEGDSITYVGDTPINTWVDFENALDAIYDKNETTITLRIERDGEELDPITIEATSYIVSIGLSDISKSNKELPTGITGVRVGANNIRYQSNSGNIKAGDIIDHVYITEYNNPNTVLYDVDVTSWSQLIKIFKEIDVANVQFGYYHLKGDDLDLSSRDSYEYVNYKDCSIIEPYTNEVLNNQRIEKIQQKIGVSPIMHFDFFGCIGSAFTNFWDDFTLIFRTLKLLIAPSGVRQVGVNDLSGFVGIFSMIETYIGAGLLALLSFSALLSVNIGVMNLLPIPALDGGRIFFLFIELITRKKPSKKIENTVNNIFFILLMILFVYITIHDIMRLF